MEENVQNFIKNLRKEYHITQKELADQLGVTYQAVSKWERGLNIPDISILKEIGRIYHVSLDNMINGEEEKKVSSSKKPFLIGIGILGIFLLLFLLFLFFRSSHEFYFKRVSSDCEAFSLSGSLAYNQDKSSIYISNIEYCGEDNGERFKKIDCNFYEEYQEVRTKIYSAKEGENVTLSEYLKDLSIVVDDYQASCKLFSSSSLFLEIHAVDQEDQVVLYQIPLKLEKNCS